MEKCDFYHIIVLSLNFPGYLKMEYGSTKMEETLSQPRRQIGFVGFLYMVWLFRLGNGAIHLGDEPDPRCPVSGFESDLGSTAGKWLGALVGFLFMAWLVPC